MAQRLSTLIAGRRWLAFAIVALALVAVGVEFAVEGPPWAGSQRVLWRGSSVAGHIDAHFRYFNGDDARPFTGTAGERLTVRFDLEPAKGTLALRLLSPGGDTLWTHVAAEASTGTRTITLPESGKYRIGVAGEQSRGGFAVDYRLASPATP
jgi:hypothetical protein